RALGVLLRLRGDAEQRGVSIAVVARYETTREVPSATRVRRLLRDDHEEDVLVQVHHDLRRQALSAARRRELLGRPAPARISGRKPFENRPPHGAPPVVLCRRPMP
ncbi:hypothetical protein ABZ702_24820, partial [Streptomyces cyaneofuscatus]